MTARHRRAAVALLVAVPVVVGAGVAASAARNAPGSGVTAQSVAVGEGPVTVAVDSTTHLAFVGSVFSQSLTVVSTDSGAVVRTVALRSAPADVAVDPRTGTVFVSSQTDTHVAVLDETGGRRGQLVLDSPAARMAVDPDRPLLFATDASPRAMGAIDVVDLRALEAGTQSLRAYPIPHGGFDVAADPVARTVWATDSRATVLSGYPVDGGGRTAVTLDDQPYDLAVDPGRRLLWFTSPAEHAVVSMSLADAVPSERSRTDVGSYPEGLAVDPGTGTVWVADEGADAVRAVDEASGDVGPAVPVGPEPRELAVDTVLHVVVVVDSGGATVHLLRSGAVGSAAVVASPTASGAQSSPTSAGPDLTTTSTTTADAPTSSAAGTPSDPAPATTPNTPTTTTTTSGPTTTTSATASDGGGG